MWKQAADSFGDFFVVVVLPTVIHHLLKQFLLLFSHYYCMALVTFVVIAAMACDTWDQNLCASVFYEIKIYGG